MPDLAALRAFLMATIGWTSERTDEVLVPVIKDMNRRETEGTQSNITGFFRGATGVGAGFRAGKKGAKRGGARLEGALGKLKEGRAGRSQAARGSGMDSAAGRVAQNRGKRKRGGRGAVEEQAEGEPDSNVEDMI